MASVRVLPLILSALLLLSACGPRGLGTPMEPLERAAHAVEGGSGDEEALALAAWHAWLVRGDAEGMRGLAERSLRGGGDPWARMALAESSRRRLDPRGEVEALAALISSDPLHPLALLSASRLEASAGISLDLDERIARASASLLEEGVPGDVALHLRGARLRIAGERGVDEARLAAREAGRVSEVALAGPRSRSSFVEFDVSHPAFEAGPIPGGDLRTVEIPDGSLSLAPEPRAGDVFHAVSVVSVPEAGRFLVRLEASRSTSVSLFLDGIPVLHRRAFGDIEPTVLLREVELTRGEHLLSVRLGRGRGNGDVVLQIAPSDGSPSALSFRAAREGDRALAKGAKNLGPAVQPARSLARRLSDFGLLASWAGARYGLGRDPEGAKSLVDAAISELPSSPPLRALRSEVAAGDPSLPAKVAESRSLADLERARERDPKNPWVLLRLARIHRAGGRWSDAEGALDEAAAEGGEGSRLLAERSRLAAARGFEPLAHALARQAHEKDPQDCQAGGLAYGAAAKERDGAGTSRIAHSLSACPGGRQRLLRLLADGGRQDEAAALAEELAAMRPHAVPAVLELAGLHLAGGAADRAAALVLGLEGAWPGASRLPRLRARYLTQAGDREGAREARLRALALDGSDLALLRAEAYERRLDILGEEDPDGLEAIRAFEGEKRAFDAPAVILVDFVGIEVLPDGSQVERTHVLTKVLEKSAVDRVGEVHLPEGAEVLELRTIKEDGRILEPELIGAKESISMPGLEPGDYVEVQTLRTIPGGTAGLEGWRTSRFYFRTRDMPILDSLFVVRADARLGLEVDRHGGAPEGELRREGSHLVYVARSRDNPAFIPEPGGVSPQEVLPWVQAGAGAGEKELALHFADRLLGAERRGLEVERWTREAAAGAPTREDALRRVWRRAMEEIEGEGSLETPASFVLASGRGSRGVVVKAALDVLGIESAWVALRNFQENPSPHRFPHQARLSKFVLVARPDPRGGWVWMDPSVRWAPLGEVSADAQGMPGWVLGKEPVPTTSPVASDVGREMRFELDLAPDGHLLGHGVEAWKGFDAAQARAALERLSEESLRQVVESTLARRFREARLHEVQLSYEEGGATLSYDFEAPRGATVGEDGAMVLDLDFMREDLGPRLLTAGSRKTPFMIPVAERQVLDVEIHLPPGLEVVAPPEAASEPGDFGSFRRTVGVLEGRIVLRDELTLERNRIPPHRYADFAAWVHAVDRAGLQQVTLR